MNQNSFTLPSFAKINLFLKIHGKRPDNFHELCTVFQTVSLHDNLSFEESDDLILKSNDKNVPIGENNLIVKAANLLLEKTKVRKGAKIYLEKRIPYPGGLGGGSSNAATALLGLTSLWDLDISFNKLCDIACEIGSDVPFFLYGGTALGVGRGTEISLLNEFDEKYLLIITPDLEISTAKAFADLRAQDLTNIDSKSILKICHEEVKGLDSGHLKFTNDFEGSVFKIEPEIKHLKQKLLQLGAREALLSGSGASVFAIFDNAEKQQFAISAFESYTNIRKFAVKTISRLEYRKFFKSCEYLLPKSF